MSPSCIRFGTDEALVFAAAPELALFRLDFGLLALFFFFFAGGGCFLAGGRLSSADDESESDSFMTISRFFGGGCWGCFGEGQGGMLLCLEDGSLPAEVVVFD